MEASTSTSTSENATDKVDYEAELIGELVDFFLTLIQQVVYHASGLEKGRKYFRFLEMYGLFFHFCKLPQIDSYVTFCVKKMVSFLLSGWLEGFQVEFYDKGQVVQRYVGIIDGKFTINVDDTKPTTADEYKTLISEVREEARRLLLSYNEVVLEIPKPGSGNGDGPNKQEVSLTRIQISLGIRNEAVENYNLYMDATNDGSTLTNNDSYIFPWSKPKAKLASRNQDVETQLIKSLTNKLDPKITTPTKAQEHQPEPNNEDHSSESQDQDISETPAAVSELKPPNVFPIETIEFGPITFCFYAVIYHRSPPKPTSRSLQILAQKQAEELESVNP